MKSPAHARPCQPEENNIDDWTSGYVADIGYTYGYYSELNPINTQLALHYAGLAPPKIATACELGFGQGMSVNVHAAASNVQWFGTDFNPSQAGFAQELAAASGAKARLFDESFAEFCARGDLPQMDYIGLHGIWSWISDENRAVIVDFVRRKLNVGGVLYISYNTQPGWAAMVPMRELFVEHAAVMGSPGQGRVAQVDAALAFADKLLEVNPAFVLANPGIPARMKKVGGFNRNYLAHEYFNRDWQPMSYARMAQWLGPAKLNFAGSANCLDPVDAMHLTAPQRALLDGIPDPGFRQTVRDFCTNQTFRRDYWVKGARRLTPVEQADALRRQLVVLVLPKEEVTFTAMGSQGEVGLHEEIYRPFVDELANHQPKSLGEIEKALAPRNISYGQVVQAAMVLVGKGSIFLAQHASLADQAKPATDRLNRHLMLANASNRDLPLLASPVTGGAVSAPRFHHLFLQSVLHGRSRPEEWARDVWGLLSAQGEKVLKDGKALETAEENLAELVARAEEFEANRLERYRTLRVI